MPVIRSILLTCISLAGVCVVNVSAASDSEEEAVVLRKHSDWCFGTDVGAGAIHLELA